MFQSDQKGLQVLEALMTSEFIFKDDVVQQATFAKHAKLVEQDIDLANGIFLIVEDTRRVKPFLQRLGFRHFNTTGVSFNQKEPRSTKAIALPPYYITVTVVKSFEAERQFVKDYFAKVEILEAAKKISTEHTTV